MGTKRTARARPTPHGSRDPLAALAEAAIADPADMWNALSRAACTACAAECAGIVSGLGREMIGRAGEGAKLSPEQIAGLGKASEGVLRSACWTDPASGKSFVIALIDRSDDGDTFAWIARTGFDFDWREALNLRAIAVLARLLRVLDQRIETERMLFRESIHRSSNDLQLVRSLLSFQARQSDQPVVQAALESAASRVMTLALARRAHDGDLTVKLRRTCEALAAHAEPRGILVAVFDGGAECRLSSPAADAILIAVNELVTNAMKHAFAEHGGLIRVELAVGDGRLTLLVEDDGAALPPTPALVRGGSGLDLIARLLGMARGRLHLPVNGGKLFRIEMPTT
jgi:two-component sensor histidine kinase